MKDKRKTTIAVSVVAVVALLALIYSVSQTMANSGQTVTEFERVPPKGIGKHDRE